MAKKTATKSKTNNSKQASPKSRKSSPAARPATKPGKAHEAAVTIDRRRRADRRDAEATTPKSEVQLERRQKVQRRRQIDPTTCERDYSVQEVEFMNAMDDYKRKSGRMFPTCSEVLEVIRGLGYVQLSPSELVCQGSLAPPVVVASLDDEEESELF